MPGKTLLEIKTLPPEAIELLEAAGHTDVGSVFEQTYDDISNEMIKANSILKIVDSGLNGDLISQWLEDIEKQTGKEFIRGGIATIQSAPQTAAPIPNSQAKKTTIPPAQRQVNSVATPSPPRRAIPLSESFTQHHHLDLSLLPQASVLQVDHSIPYHSTDQASPANHYTDSKSSSQQTASEASTTSSNQLFGNESTNKASAKPLDKSRILSMEAYMKDGSNVEVQETHRPNNITKTTREETNKGVNPESKFFIKGVLHQDIFKFKTGSYAFLFSNFLVVAAFLITPLAIIDKEKYWWSLFGLLLLLPALFIYFTTAQRASCPVCTQKQYALKRCLKHKNAHRWPIFGYMLPTCLHAMFFKWFRCIFCGTSVRLKE